MPLADPYIDLDLDLWVKRNRPVDIVNWTMVQSTRERVENIKLQAICVLHGVLLMSSYLCISGIHY